MVKSIYGILIDEGCNVDIADHPALAVQMVLNKHYTVIIIDSEPFGLSGNEAIEIIRNVYPEIPVISVGYPGNYIDAMSINAPLDLEEFKQTIYDIVRRQSIN